MFTIYKLLNESIIFTYLLVKSYNKWVFYISNFKSIIIENYTVIRKKSTAEYNLIVIIILLICVFKK